MGGLVMKWLGLAPKAAEMQPLRRPEQATLPVMRVMTLPGGEKIRVMREDAFERAITRRTLDAA